MQSVIPDHERDSNTVTLRVAETLTKKLLSLVEGIPDVIPTDNQGS